MLDVRVLAYVVPLAEQVLDDITPVIQVKNYADEDAVITGLIRIYRKSTDTLEYSSQLATTILAHGTQANIAALSAWSPGAPADHDYFILAEILATSFLPGPPIRPTLGSFTFDIKPGPMGPAPAAHHATHENGGMDPVDVDGMPGVLAEPQTPVTHATTHEDGGADPLNVGGLFGQLADDQPALPHDIADPTRHTSAATPGQILQADANGLPADATNTDADVSDAVTKRNCRADGVASNAAPTPNADTTDLYYLSALADNATFGAPTGSPVEGQKLIIRIIDAGAAKTLAWDAGAGGYIARGTALPTTTVISKYLYVGFLFNAIANLWDCVASSQEA
jgi:hypothetical protein